MFTLNAKLIEQAAASGSPRDYSQALANCAAPLLHRGPILTAGQGNVLGAAGKHTPPGYQIGGPNIDLKFINVEIPPWQNIPFTPTPLVDMPQYWANDYVPSWPDAASNGLGSSGGDPGNVAGSVSSRRSADGGGRMISGGESALAVRGDARLGNTTTKNLTAQDLRSQNITNNQHFHNLGDVHNAGDIYIGTPNGSSPHGGDRESRGRGNAYFYNSTYHGGDVTTAGDVRNFNTVSNQFVTNNQSVNSYGPSNSYSTLNNYGPSNSYSTSNNYSTTHFHGPTIHRSDAYHQTLLANGSGSIGRDLVVKRNATVNGDLLTLGNVEHRLDAGETFAVTLAPGTQAADRLLAVDSGAPAVPSITIGRWLNAQVSVFLGGDTHLWRNYLYVSTKGNDDGYTKLDLQEVQLVTDVTWGGDKLSVETTKYRILAEKIGEPSSSVILECPI